MIPRLLCCLLLTAAAPSAAAQSRDELFKEIDTIFADLSKITGLAAKHPVRHDFIRRAELKSFLEKRMKEAVKPEEIRAEEATLKKFGLAPPEFDLKQTTIALLTEQAAAFYDYKKKRLFILEGASEEMQRIALVHELAHALADQHFNLAKFIKDGKSDDSSTARVAVMEGQAQWLMLEFSAQRLGQSLKTSPKMAGMLNRMAEAGTGEYPELDKAPMYLRETLMFPYTSGMAFQNALVPKLGEDAFRRVFLKPPQSTQQILHPEMYLSETKPTAPVLPVLPSKQGLRELVRGSIGELDHTLLLRQYAGKETAERLAPKWRGGAYRIYERKADKTQSVLIYASQWEDAGAAAEYFRAYEGVLKGKWKKFEVKERSATRIAGEGDDGRFEVTLEGAIVRSAEGLR